MEGETSSRLETPVKYLILIYGNPASRAIWDGMNDADRAEGYTAYTALSSDLAESGEMVVSEALDDPAQAKRVLARDGTVVVSDGPYAESKEHLAGFYLVDCESFERAVEHAARVPEAAYGLVEVRAVIDLSGLTK
jgi:hypothetical protein